MNRLLSFLFVCLMQVSLAIASTYSLHVEVTPNGSGSLNVTEGAYEEGSSVYLVTYNNTGYVFRGWYDGSTLLSSSKSFYYTMPSNDVLVQARYEYDPAAPSDPSLPDTTTYYSFNAAVSPIGAGTVNVTEARYAADARVPLWLYSNTGYKFIGWQDENGNSLSTSTSFTYTMPHRDVSLTALYSYDPTVPSDPNQMGTRYTVTVVPKPIGAGSFNTTEATAEEGGDVRLYAYCNTGYQFLHWENEEGEILSSEQNFSYVMPHGNTVVYGVFDYNPAPPSNPNKNYWNPELGEVIIDDFTPGNLESAVSYAIAGSSRSDVAMITVAGMMSYYDFGIANNYTNCTLLDLSRVTGITEVPMYAFDNTNLESVYLPSTIEKIGTYAFYNCHMLSAITVYAMVPPVLEYKVFDGISDGMVVYVPATSIPQYQEAEGWKDFTILPIQEDIRNISISLPAGALAADYQQMWLELTNMKSGQKMHYIMTDRTTYTFANVIRNTLWNAVVRNERGDIFGQIDNIDVQDEDVSVTFASLSKPQNVSLSVKTPDGTDVTDETQVTWLDDSGNYLAQATGLSGLLAGSCIAYKVQLSQELAMQYVVPQQTDYVINETDNNVSLTLSPIRKVKLTGSVRDLATKKALHGATVTVSQTFGGKYSKTVSTKTDADGNYMLDISEVSTTMAVSASDYISQTIDCDSLMTGNETITMSDIPLKGISGAVVTLGMTYTRCPSADGDADVFQNWYDDYNNITYNIYNRTKLQAIGQFNVQYPQIVLLEEVAEGDVLELTATSKVGAFMPVKATATIDAEQCANAMFNIVELGKIRASYTKNSNVSVVGSLYDANDRLVKTQDYSNASLTFNDLADGSYTLVTMGSSKLFNTIYDLSQLPQTGLVPGSDYTQANVTVSSGKVSVIDIDEVPTLDESKLYYTGDNTSFSVNKSSIVVGNYLTMTGHIDFKTAYAGKVSNVSLIVDLPEASEFVENSVMVGNNTGSYTLQDHRVTIPMARYTDRVRFCVIPTLGGGYAPSALVQFDVDGATVTQPIGSANYTAKDLSIIVPSTIAKTVIPISGTAIGASTVEIYDNDILIGQTQSLSNGLWNAKCELNETHNLSIHNIHAKVRTKAGLELLSENIDCLYDKNAIEVNTITMINTAHDDTSLDLCDYVTVVDLQNPKTSYPPYWYWPSYPKFTFIVDLTNNDPTTIEEVELYVYTDNGGIVALYPTYDANKDAYIANAEFDTYSLPVNVNADFKLSQIADFTMEDILECLPENVREGSYEIIRNQEIEKSFLLLDKYQKPMFYHNMLFAQYDKNTILPDIEAAGFDKVILTDNSAIYSHNTNSFIMVDVSGKACRIDGFISPKEQYVWDDILALLSGNSQAGIARTAPDPFKPEISDPLGWLRDAPLKKILDEARRKYECASDDEKEYLKQAIRDLRNGITFLGAGAAASTIGTTSAAVDGDIYGSLSEAGSFGEGTEGLMHNANFWKNYIHGLPECPKDPNPTPRPKPGPDIPHVLDPSGYVYEAVSSNRVQGVIATAYYKEMVEDMYGDLHENIVKWDAAEYAQENPLFTDKDGRYAWDVPNGLWQVKFEKEGYETAYSEWLPVPPPQLDINIPMKQNVQPNVKFARAFENAVEVEFDKYMMPEFLTTDNIIVMTDGKQAEGTIELLNEEVRYEGETETFASKLRFNAAEPFDGEEIILIVSNRVKSYAGIRMQDDYSQAFTIEREVRQIVCEQAVTMGYGSSKVISVTALPAVASKGKILNIRSSSSMILGTDKTSVVLDDNGTAVLSVSGELPGTASLTFTIEGYNLSASVIVNVEQIEPAAVATPVASIASGTTVSKGTEVALSCETEGATIYYTLDGSCPCDEATRLVYSSPIVINQTVTIKAMAVAADMAESYVAEFYYIIEDDSGIDEVTIDEGLRIYPLPVHDKLNVSLGGKIIKSVTLTSLSGSVAVKASKPVTHVTLDVSSLTPGIYLINVATEDKTYSRKIMKLR